MYERKTIASVFVCPKCGKEFTIKRYTSIQYGMYPRCTKCRRSKYFASYYDKNKRKFNLRRKTQSGVFACTRCGILVEKTRCADISVVLCEDCNPHVRKRTTVAGIFPCEVCMEPVVRKRYKQGDQVRCAIHLKELYAKNRKDRERTHSM